MKTIPDALNPKFHMQIGSQSRHNSLATMVVTLLAAVFSALAVTQHWSDTGSLILLVLVTCVTLVLITAPAQAGSFVAAGSANALLRGRARAVSTLLLAMSPVILLGLAFPFASQRLAAASIDGVPLTMIVLGVSAAVPWFSQMTCMPIYRMLNSGGLQNLSELSSKLYGAWRTLLLWSIPPVTLLIIPVALFTGWSVRPLLVYLVLALLHVIFVQSLVVADVAGHRRIWALAWLAYGLAVAVVPTWWFLPPHSGNSQPAYVYRWRKGLLHSSALAVAQWQNDRRRHGAWSANRCRALVG